MVAQLDAWLTGNQEILVLIERPIKTIAVYHGHILGISSSTFLCVVLLKLKSLKYFFIIHVHLCFKHIIPFVGSCRVYEKFAMDI